MTVIISDSRNASYNGNLSTANGWYRAESFNLGIWGGTTGGLLSLASARTIAVTFANAGNCQGIVLDVTSNAGWDRSLLTELNEAKTVVGFSTSTEKVNITGHGLADQQPVRFTSTGALPGGVTANTLYYVKSTSEADYFQLSTTPGGAAINLTGTPSGTATCWVVRATETLTASQVFDISRIRSGDTIVPVKFTTPYAVDTVAGKWRFYTIYTGGTTGTIYLRTSDGTVPFYAAWCDNKVTASSGNDVLIMVDAINIDASFTTSAVLSTGDTTRGVALVICRSNTRTPLLTCYAPAAAYTFTVSGVTISGNGSGYQFGTSAAPISAANKLTVVFPAPAAGTVVPNLGYSYVGVSTTYDYGNKSFLECYGEVPTYPIATLSQDAASGQNVINVNETTGWVIGNRIIVGKASVAGLGETTVFTINNIVGKVITLSGNLASTHLTGGTVMNPDAGFGIEFKSTVASTFAYLTYKNSCSSKLTLSGCLLTNTAIYNTGQGTYMAYDDDATYTAQHVIQDCMQIVDYAVSQSIYQQTAIPQKGVLVTRCYSHRGGIVSGNYALYGTFAGQQFRSGTVEMSYCYLLNKYAAYQFSVSTFNTKAIIHHNVFENSAYVHIYMAGLGWEVYNNYFYGSSASYLNSVGALLFTTLAANFYLHDNQFVNNHSAYVFGNGSFSNCHSHDESFSSTTMDIAYLSSSFVDYAFEDCTGITYIDNSYQADLVPGSKIRFVNYNGTANNDTVILPEGHYQRTGDGLTDTNVHTAGTGKFALRLQPELLTSNLAWSQNVPTGNIQNKTMAVAVWVKINSANFYAGTHQMPRLTIDYDNGTEVYVDAVEGTGWQQLLVHFVPSTTYGQIVVTVDGFTDATGTDAYFYMDDFSVLYPPGVIVNLGGLDDWSQAEPISPTISTLFSATDVWSVPSSILTGSGTIGKQTTDDLKTIKGEVI